MNVCEHEGKALLKKHGFRIPNGVLLSHPSGIESAIASVPGPWVLKAQLLSGNRAAQGAIAFVDTSEDLQHTFSAWQTRGWTDALLEERVAAKREFYVSCVYDVEARGPLLLIGAEGGSGIEERRNVRRFKIDPQNPGASIAAIASELAAISPELPEWCAKIVEAFFEEHARQIEINPLAERADGTLIALDAKVALDDAVHDRSAFGGAYRALDGDIATLFSGGGASFVNMDAMRSAGLRAANYAEYSGNPPKEKVRDLAKLVLSKPGLRGALIIGGIANFTDVRETFAGIAEALDEIKPSYPIVVRRSGPREREGLALLAACAERNGVRMTLFGKETPMEDAVREMQRLTL